MSIIRYACHTERSNFVAESSVSLACPVQDGGVDNGYEILQSNIVAVIINFIAICAVYFTFFESKKFHNQRLFHIAPAIFHLLFRYGKKRLHLVPAISKPIKTPKEKPSR